MVLQYLRSLGVRDIASVLDQLQDVTDGKKYALVLKTHVALRSCHCVATRYVHVGVACWLLMMQRQCGRTRLLRC